jgi:hypothetical protein
MPWLPFALSIAVMLIGVSCGFLCLRRASGYVRIAGWLTSCGAVASAPALIPLHSQPGRFLATLLAILFLTKLYDALRTPNLCRELSFLTFWRYATNGFWLVWHRRPPFHFPRRDKFIATSCSVVAVGMVLLLVWLWRRDWSAQPFALEHAAKVTWLVATAAFAANVASSWWRLAIGPALTPMGNVLFPATPAKFWSNWNRPAQQFFREYVFVPTNGFHHPVRGVLATFAISGLVHEYVLGTASGRIQGTQLAFFLIQGIAVATTHKHRPRGKAIMARLATAAFNLATSVLFFHSVNQTLPFYSTR